MDAALLAISPLDGRYQSKAAPLQDYLSEFGLIKYRLYVEIQWLIYLCNEIKLPGTHALSEENITQLNDIHNYFDTTEAQKVKTTEATTNHDVKAVEYYLKERLVELKLQDLEEFVHFGCTSEDINNTAYGLMLQHAANSVITPQLKELLATIESYGREHKALPMLSRTHGQPASPTTLGKEFINYAARLQRSLAEMNSFQFLGKWNGATGNYNAHTVANAKIDWIAHSQKFVEHLGLKPNLWTTQIEPHDGFSQFFAILRRSNTILLDLATDIWQYISINYFGQQTKKGEIGSSTMPHKVNPIDFENAEGNFQLANAVMNFLETKLTTSRLQRDLSDSTVQRNMGTAMGYSLIAYKALAKGLGKLKVNSDVIAADLEDHWVVVAEAFQTIMRRHHIEKPYEKLKELTRGQVVNANTFREFVANLDAPKEAIKAMEAITPQNYIGLASKLVDLYFESQ